MKQVKVFDEAFAEKLKRLRKERGFTLQQLSVLTGVSASYLSRLERNEKQSPTFPILMEIAKALSVEVMTLVESVYDENEVLDLKDIMLKSSLKVNGKVLTGYQKDKILQIIECIIEFRWTEDFIWKELGELGLLITEIKSIEKI